MKSIKVREITAYKSKLCEMMAANMNRLSPTSSNLEPKCEFRISREPGVRITREPGVRITCEPGVRITCEPGVRP